MKLLPRIARRLRQLLPGAVILLYHRVAEESADPQLLCVKPDNFAAHMEILRRDFRPTSLTDLRHRMRYGTVPPRTVVVTFDDGYVDNFINARPILQESGVPATVFVTSGQVDSPGEFWWDALETLLLRTPRLPSELDMKVGLQEMQFVIDDAHRPVDPAWNVFATAGENGRQRLYLKIAEAIKELPATQQTQALASLANWASVSQEQGTGRRAMTAEELRLLVAGGLIEVGAHTMTHAQLSTLSPSEQRSEIETSRSILERLLGRPITSFAYPYGGERDYTDETVRLVKGAGLSVACANRPGRATCLSDPYQLPRWVVRDCDGDQFSRQLKGWFS